MIAILRKNVVPLVSNHTSFACKFNFPFAFSHIFFSNLGATKLVSSDRLYNVIVHKHQISPEVASVAASALKRCKSPEMADSMMSFLKERGFSSTQLQKIVKFRPQILAAGYQDDIKLKIRIFQDLGLSPGDIAKIISYQMRILSLSAKTRIIPSLSLLKDLFGGSNVDVAKALRKSASILTSDLEKTLVPNVAFLKSIGVPLERIRVLLRLYPRCPLVKPDVMRGFADKAKEMGFSQSSRMFVQAVGIISSLSKETWEVKWQAFRDLGFSDSDISAIFRKSPVAFSLSMEKVRAVTELLLATGKFDISTIVSSPVSLGYSINKRLKPRLQILEFLESRNLIKKWPTLGSICVVTDGAFMERFITPYSNELAKYPSQRVAKGNINYQHNAVK